MRINRALASLGYGSRRAVEELIVAGKVQVNGVVVTILSAQVDPEKDKIVVAGRKAPAKIRTRILAFYKPRGVLSTWSDERGRKCLADFFPAIGDERVFAVGRLDKDSEGLLLLTNDGDFAQRLLHPSAGIVKSYEVQLDRPLAPEHRERMLEGLWSEGEFLRPLSIRSLGVPDRRWTVFDLVEGKKREIRRLAALFEYGVLRLIRRRVGKLELRRLETGVAQELSGEALWRQILSGGIV